jgi:hypothetical protein
LIVEKGAAGQITVTNGLGSEIASLALMDEQQHVHVASGPIAAGKKVVLLPESGTPPAPVRQAHTFDEIWNDAGQFNWTTDPARLASESWRSRLRPGTYIATLQDPVFIESGLGTIKDWQTQSAVFGRFALNSDTQETTDAH